MGVISVTSRSDTNIYDINCTCGFFDARGSKRIDKVTAYFTARLAAKKHNRNFHRGKYKISTEGSELF